jgi:hypothetical protein
MVIYIIKWTIIYVVLIFLLHNLYLFFQNNLTSTIIKDYYNTYNNDVNNNTQINTIKTRKTTLLSNKLQIGSTGLEELNKYYGSTNNGLINNEFTNNEFTNNEFTNTNNGLTNDMKSELNDFFNKLKL